MEQLQEYFAPKSGKETREDIKKFAEDTKEKGEELFERGKKEVEVKIENIKRRRKITEKFTRR